MPKRSTLMKGFEGIKVAAAEKKPLKQKRDKKLKAANGTGMNGPHRPKLLGANVEVEVHKAFKNLANDEDTSIQRLVAEALNDLLAKRGSKVRTVIE